MSVFQNIFKSFVNPEFFWLLLIIPLLIVWYVYRYKKQTTNIKLSTLETLQHEGKSLKAILYHSLFIIRLLAIILFIICLARPQSHSTKYDSWTEGIDIVLSIDISETMLAEDFRPNRLEAAKAVAMNFIKDRPNDRIGLVVFGTEAFTQCPLTHDHSVMKNLFKDIKVGLIEGRTAIGDGIATAVNRLRDSKAISKVIILLTDGMSNAGSVDPMTAAEIAKIYKIRVYTIGVGSYGEAQMPVQTPFGIQYVSQKVEIDEALLKNVSDYTDGKYFRAANKSKLEQIYKEIDKLEKTKIESYGYKRYKDYFVIFAIFGTALLLLEFILRKTYFRSIN